MSKTKQPSNLVSDQVHLPMRSSGINTYEFQPDDWKRILYSNKIHKARFKREDWSQGRITYTMSKGIVLKFGGQRYIYANLLWRVCKELRNSLAVFTYDNEGLTITQETGIKTRVFLKWQDLDDLKVMYANDSNMAYIQVTNESEDNTTRQAMLEQVRVKIALVQARIALQGGSDIFDFTPIATYQAMERS